MNDLLDGVSPYNVDVECLLAYLELAFEALLAHGQLGPAIYTSKIRWLTDQLGRA